MEDMEETAMSEDSTRRIVRYRLLTGPDDATFCKRVSEALAKGWELYGSPSISVSGDRVMVAQAVILREGAPD